MNLPRLAVVCDYREENWPSMDLVAEMLLGQLEQKYSHLFAATRICPPLRRRFTKQRSEDGGQRSEVSGQMSEVGSQKSGLGTRLFNADRALNRFWDYPQFLKGIRNEFDLFHVVDHSYGQLLHELPPERTIVTCHDLDTFQSLLNPDREPRSVFFRKMMERTLSGFRQAARVACVSAATRAELIDSGLVEPDRAVVVANGVHPSCSTGADPIADQAAARLLGEFSEGEAADTIELLHVGSTIPRKRVDFLLRIFAAVRNEFPKARLLRAGGPFTDEQRRLMDELDLARSVVVLPHLQRNVLAAVYRRAALVLLPSAREGFGLPVLESLACGTPVVASDLPALREVGGNVIEFCPVGDLQSWVGKVTELLGEKDLNPWRWEERRAAGVGRAARFSWAEHGRKMVDVYQSVLNGN